MEEGGKKTVFQREHLLESVVNETYSTLFSGEEVRGGADL